MTNNHGVHQPVIKVLGLGGGGSNAVDRMMELGMRGVEFIVANTDRQVLELSHAPTKIQLGPKLTRGLGAGGRPEIGREAALESRHALADALHGADMVFLTAGMGGGTGTGSIPIAAEIARQQQAVTIAVVTMPFSFEMSHRQQNAIEGLKTLRQHTDTLITIPNDRLLQIAPRDLPLSTAFRLADDVLRQAVQSISELITEPGYINVDFAHIRRLMQLGGGALMAIGYGEGEGKAIKAVQQALEHPLLESVSLQHAAGVIASFTASEELSLQEFSEALIYLQEQANPETEIIIGTTVRQHMGERAQVNLVVTGVGAPTLEDVLPGAERLREERLSVADERIPAAAVSATDLDIPAFLRRQSRLVRQ